MYASITTPLASVKVPLRASSVTRSLTADRLPLTLMLPLTDLSRMFPSPTAAVPAVTAPVENVPPLTNVTSPPRFEAEASVPTLLSEWSRTTEPEVFVTARVVAVMAADCVTFPAAESVTVLPAMPGPAKSKPV